MGVKADKAKSLFLEGYNCAQAVAGAFYEELGLDFETAIKLSSSFGGGMGRLREVCGAVSGMFMVAGVLYGYTDTSDNEAKAKHYELIQSLAKKFSDKKGYIVCRDLLSLAEGKDNPTPSERTKQYYERRPCAEYVYDAALIIEEYIANN